MHLLSFRTVHKTAEPSPQAYYFYVLYIFCFCPLCIL